MDQVLSDEVFCCINFVSCVSVDKKFTFELIGHSYVVEVCRRVSSEVRVPNSLDVVVVLSHVGGECTEVGAGCCLDIGINRVHWAVQVEDAFCRHLAPINLNLLDKGDFLC